MAVQAVLFDLDDTLFDHRHARLAALRTIRSIEPALARYSLAHLARECDRVRSEVHFALVVTGKISPEESRWRRMTRFLAEHRIDLPRTRIRELVDLRTESYRRNRRAVPGAEALLRQLHASDAKIAVVTNNLVTEQVEKLAVTGLDHLVDHLVCSEEVGVTKPAPQIFRVALQRAGARPGTAVMVGDSWEYDIVGARRLGIRAIWFHRDDRPRPSQPRADELRSFRPLARASSLILGGPPGPRR